MGQRNDHAEQTAANLQEAVIQAAAALLDDVSAAREHESPAMLLKLLRELDLGLNASDIYEQAGISYLELRRWKGGDNDQAVIETKLLRRLVRDKLGTFTVEEIGAATMQELDADA